MAPVHPDTPASVTAWVAADRRLDLAVMEEQLASDVVLVSPLTDRFRFEGPREVMAVFAAAFELLEDIEIAGVTGAGDDWVLHGTNTIDGANLEEIQWLHLDAAGRIDRVTLFIRPAPAVLALFARIGPRLSGRGVLPPAAGLASVSLRPLALGLRLVERHLMPRLGPRAVRPRGAPLGGTVHIWRSRGTPT